VTVFVDTSALYALMVRTEDGHAEVSAAFQALVGKRTPLVTSNYVLLETVALLQRRIGVDAVRDLTARLVPLFTVHWIGEALHRQALDRLVRGAQRGLSLVDLTSFELMDREGITRALALDADFTEAGYRVIPSGR